MTRDRGEYAREWASKRKHPCVLCGKLVDYRARMCQQCAPRLRIKPKPECLDCKKELKNYKALRCQSCEQKRRWKNGEVTTLIKTGTKHHNWKGGINRQKGGYILLLCPEHPRANRDGYAREHILVWEKYNKKPLPTSWIIHHLNGIKSDNRICNLVALPRKQHSLVLQAKARRIQELEALLNGQGQLL